MLPPAGRAQAYLLDAGLELGLLRHRALEEQQVSYHATTMFLLAELPLQLLPLLLQLLPIMPIDEIPFSGFPPAVCLACLMHYGVEHKYELDGTELELEICSHIHCMAAFPVPLQF